MNVQFDEFSQTEHIHVTKCPNQEIEYSHKWTHIMHPFLHLAFPPQSYIWAGMLFHAIVGSNKLFILLAI